MERNTMPRKRQTEHDKILKALGTILAQEDETMATRGRPRKLKKPENYEDATIAPVANGYVVTSSTTGKNLFVFEDLDKAFEFVRSSLKPTAEQSEFLGKV